MHRLEITITNPETPNNLQVLWRDVETYEDGVAWGQDAVLRYGEKNIPATFTVSEDPVKYRFTASGGDDFANIVGSWTFQSDWFLTPQHAANIGWKEMKKWALYNVKPDTSMIIDNTEPTHILFRLLGEGDVKPDPIAPLQIGENFNDRLNQVEEILNNYFRVNLGRNLNPWKTNGRNILDISIKPPTGMSSGSAKIAAESARMASQQLSLGKRILDVHDEGSFFVDVNDKEVIRLLDLLETMGRKVNKTLLCTQRQ